ALGCGGSAIARSTATLCWDWLALHATACQRLRVLIMTVRMNKSYTVLIIILSALSQVACGDRAVDTADSLAKDSERLKIVMRQCRDRSATVDEKTCAAASDAWRRRFLNPDSGDQRAEPSPSSQVPSRSTP